MAVLTLFTITATAWANVVMPEGVLEDRELEMRDRYEQALQRNPFQEQAFERVYKTYLEVDGIDAWVSKLETGIATSETQIADRILLARILDRRFEPESAIEQLEKAEELGEDRPEFKLFLGELCYSTGRDDRAIELLDDSLETLTDSEKRAQVCRMLGSLFLRQGEKDQAIEVWKRVTEQNPTDIFSQLELADIYEENRMWEEAIGTYEEIIRLSENDPYRRCRAMRSIAKCLIDQERYQEAIAKYEEALELVAPGNWLFEDIKGKLVTVYQDLGDLNGLVSYLKAKLELSPNDLEFKDLLAETYTRMGQFEEAEKKYLAILERKPRDAGSYEKLIALYERMEQPEKVVGSFEKLIELYPSDTDYTRRLGEFHLRQGKPELAKETWASILTTDSSANRQAELAGWLEEYSFPEEAIAAYEKALEKEPNKEWSFRMGALKFDAGDEEGALKAWLGTLNEETSHAADFAEVASLLATRNLIEHAEPLYRKAAEKDPNNLEHQLALAKNLARQERFEQALPLYEQLASASEEQEYFRDQGERGMLDMYSELGTLEEKQKEWEETIEANPDKPDLLMKLARLYERAGNREKALPLYERCVELAPDEPD
ncbi:MAG: tetratricopeptide repeat protein, partial [Candidatus Omnitrophica bacterium]|nr:tetratricopeptide repeat protein [Candidatus Omnitrophota bacterium]